MWLTGSLHAFGMAVVLMQATAQSNWVVGQDILKNPTMTEPVGWKCLYHPAVLDPDFHYGHMPSASLKGTNGNFFTEGSRANLVISPVPCNTRLHFTFFANTSAAKQKISLIVFASDSQNTILQTFADGPNGPFGGEGVFAQIVGLRPNRWVKVERSYVLPKGTATLHISVNNGNPEDIHIANGRLTVGKASPTTSQAGNHDTYHVTNW